MERLCVYCDFCLHLCLHCLLFIAVYPCRDVTPLRNSAYSAPAAAAAAYTHVRSAINRCVAGMLTMPSERLSGQKTGKMNASFTVCTVKQ